MGAGLLMFVSRVAKACRAVPVTCVPARHGPLALADVPDRERRDGGPERVIRRKDAVIPVPVLPRRRNRKDAVIPGTPRDTWRGDIRLEAATGEDFSELVDIPRPDGLMERSFQFVTWLAKNNPQGKWEYFIDQAGTGLNWEDVIVVGLSHGSTTAARFAQHKKLDRVLCFSGPRDQDQSWQKLPSATPSNRYFMFTGFDRGWESKHYCRSWELLGLHEHGPIVDVETTPPPYGNTRRLITSIEPAGSKVIHNAVAPNDAAIKKDGKYVHEPVWRYMLTHPVDKVGEATPLDPDCQTQGK